MDPYGSYNDTKTKRCQVVYLSEVKHLEPEQIHEYVKYAISTIYTYIYIYKEELLEEAKKLFNEVETVIISKIENLGKKGEEKCYLFKFYTDEGILFTKVGTTTREIMTRLKEEIRNYKKSGFRITKAIIENVIDCGLIPAEGLESFCRAKFIRDYPNSFKKNDRFMEIDIPVSYFNKLTKMYLSE